MLQNFNLLATTSRGNEEDASSELRYLLGKIGDPQPEIDHTGVSGLIAAKTGFDPFDTVEDLRRILVERPYQFRYTLRIIPIEKVVTTDLDEIRRVAGELSSKISEDEAFRVTVEKRFTELHRAEIIDVAAEDIERNVDLTEPDKILLIEVVSGLTGISVIEPGDIISVIKEKLL